MRRSPTAALPAALAFPAAEPDPLRKVHQRVAVQRAEHRGAGDCVAADELSSPKTQSQVIPARALHSKSRHVDLESTFRASQKIWLVAPIDSASSCAVQDANMDHFERAVTGSSVLS